MEGEAVEEGSTCLAWAGFGEEKETLPPHLKEDRSVCLISQVERGEEFAWEDWAGGRAVGGWGSLGVVGQTDLGSSGVWWFWDEWGGRQAGGWSQEGRLEVGGRGLLLSFPFPLHLPHLHAPPCPHPLAPFTPLPPCPLPPPHTCPTPPFHTHTPPACHPLSALCHFAAPPARPLLHLPPPSHCHLLSHASPTTFHHTTTCCVAGHFCSFYHHHTCYRHLATHLPGDCGLPAFGLRGQWADRWFLWFVLSILTKT